MIGWFLALSTGRKIAVGLGALVLLIGAVAGLVLAVNAHDAGQRQAGRDEVQAKWNAEKAARSAALADFQAALGGALRTEFDKFDGRLATIEGTGSRISVELPKAIAASPRYADPNCALTPEVMAQINAARRLSAQPQTGATP